MNLVGVSGRARPRHNLEKDLECPKGNPTNPLRLESYDSSHDSWYVLRGQVVSRSRKFITQECSTSYAYTCPRDIAH